MTREEEIRIAANNFCESTYCKNVIRWSPQFVCMCKDKYDNLYLCSSYYSDSLDMFGIAVIISKQQLNDYLNGINDDITNIFVKNSEENKYNKYDVWMSADLKYMRTFTKIFAVASYRKNYFYEYMLPESNEETERYKY